MASKAVKLLQGYLWHPKTLSFDPKTALPAEWVAPFPELAQSPVYLLSDPIHAPMAFFENGTPTEGHRFHQITLLVRTHLEPTDLKPLSQWSSEQLGPWLNATPPEVGWLILEDLRQV